MFLIRDDLLFNIQTKTWEPSGVQNLMMKQIAGKSQFKPLVMFEPEVASKWNEGEASFDKWVLGQIQ